MKKYLNTRQMILAGLLLFLLIACGAVFAYMFMRTTPKSTQFIPAKVACAVQETESVEMGQLTKSSIKVENTGNIDAYLRVRLVPYWYDPVAYGIAAKTSPVLSFIPANGWIAGSDNTYYYPLPVDADSPNDVTPELLPAPIVLDVSAEGYEPRIDVFAEAIQALPTAAVTTSWGVTLAADNKTIATVSTP